MTVDWENVLQRLRSSPPGVHKVLSPCSEERIKFVEHRFGKLPPAIADMLQHFNGAELFIRGLPLVSIFGIATIPPLPSLVWAPEWTIDQYIPRWRITPTRQNDWPIAIMNYGGLVLVEANGITKEWDRSQQKWSGNATTFDKWVEEILRQGDAYLTD